MKQTAERGPTMLPQRRISTTSDFDSDATVDRRAQEADNSCRTPPSQVGAYSPEGSAGCPAVITVRGSDYRLADGDAEDRALDAASDEVGTHHRGSSCSSSSRSSWQGTVRSGINSSSCSETRDRKVCSGAMTRCRRMMQVPHRPRSRRNGPLLPFSGPAGSRTMPTSSLMAQSSGSKRLAAMSWSLPAASPSIAMTLMPLSATLALASAAWKMLGGVLYGGGGGRSGIWGVRLLLLAGLLSGEAGRGAQEGAAGGAHALKAHIPGDIILGGLFPIHVKVSDTHTHTQVNCL